jgi:toxin HigB-1
MILSFRSKSLKRFWQKNDAAGIRPDWVNRVRLVLSLLDKAARPEDANVPGLNFHALTGGQTGRFSLLVSRNWRITFAWQDIDAIDVDLEDYHG